ncbi:phage tail tape measure protein [Breoghania sp. JC706]|uniref:phage tail tape measure protein n=1 Tax=Breoghania sp. JC706 TaxID=3117732 RepID=UPI00300AAD85
MGLLKSTLRIGLDDRLSGKGKGLLGTLNRLSAAGSRFNNRMAGPAAASAIGGYARRLVALGGAYIGFRNTLGAAFDFEDKFAEVRKVIDTTPAGLDHLRKQILKMSTTLSGVSAGGLTEIMAEAGQAGIAVERLARFTEFTAKATVAFDMAASDAGNIFAKLGNVYSLNQEKLEHLANTTNYLSNSMAAKASEILNFTNRAAGAADTLNLLPDQMAAVGAAMTAAGIVPETAARGMNAFANKMVKGGPKVERAFKMVGLSFKQWSKLKKENGPAALMALFEALNKDPDGAKAIQDLVGQDFSDDFGKLMKNPKLLSQAFRLAGDEAKIAGSVQAEYANKVATDIGRIRRLGNHLRAIGIQMGSIMAGPLGAGAERLSGIFDTLDQRVTVFDKIKAGLDGLGAGLGFKDGAGMLSSLGDWLERGIFGNVATFEADTDRLGQISLKLKEIGENFRAAFDALSGGKGAVEVLSGLGEGISGMGSAMSIGGAIVLGLTAGKLLKLAGALVTFGLGSRLVRWTVIAAGLSQLGKAGSEMSAVDWAVAAGGIAMMTGELIGLAKAGGKAYRAVKWILRGEAAAGAAGVAGGVAGKVAKGGMLARLGRIAKHPLALGAVAAAWALSNQTDKSKNKDLIGEVHRRNRRASSRLHLAPGGDYTLGSFGGFRAAGKGADTKDGFVNAPLAFRRSEAAVSGLPSAHQSGLSGGRPAPADISLSGQSIEALLRPKGTQDVRVMNPPPALSVPVSVTVHATTNVDPAAIGEEAGKAVGEAVGNALREAYTD